MSLMSLMPSCCRTVTPNPERLANRSTRTTWTAAMGAVAVTTKASKANSRCRRQLVTLNRADHRDALLAREGMDAPSEVGTEYQGNAAFSAERLTLEPPRRASTMSFATLVRGDVVAMTTTSAPEPRSRRRCDRSPGPRTLNPRPTLEDVGDAVPVLSGPIDRDLDAKGQLGKSRGLRADT